MRWAGEGDAQRPKPAQFRRPARIPTGHLRADRYLAGMDAPPQAAPPTWLLDSLARSDAQADAGETLPLETVLTRARASLARMKSADPAPELLPARKA